MSIWADFGALRDELVADFEVPTATVTSITRTQSASDRASGRVAKTTSTRTVPALLGKRVVKVMDGTIITQTIARCFAEVVEGETLVLGSHTYTIGSVEPNDPTGSNPYVWVAVLR